VVTHGGNHPALNYAGVYCLEKMNPHGHVQPRGKETEGEDKANWNVV
jgi:hypothetical protein